MAQPVTPRHAASLVIYREGAKGREVFMGRRHQAARFQPGVYVFPGGMIERSDHLAHSISDLDRSITAKIAVGGSHGRAAALAMAAVRETFEETGLVVGAPGEVGPSRDPTWSRFRELGLAPDLQQLGYIGRAITPSAQSIRFHARFFFVSDEHVRGDIVASDELEDLQWVSLEKLETLPVMTVTKLMLETLNRRLAGEITTAPFLSFQNGHRLLRWQ
jgi:8-oxo-dGTP pyrophosphatase MutT (NUDIX family)